MAKVMVFITCSHRQNKHETLVKIFIGCSHAGGLSNGPKAGGQQGMHRPLPPHKDGGRPDHGSTASPTDRWQHTSPLARVEAAPRKR